MKRNPHIGSSLNDFLKAEGFRKTQPTTRSSASSRGRSKKAMQKQGITKVEMARRMAQAAPTSTNCSTRRTTKSSLTQCKERQPLLVAPQARFGFSWPDALSVVFGL